MAQNENLTKLHAQQVKLAQEIFEEYKDFIVTQFVSEYGGSYQTAADCKDTWRKEFAYSIVRETFLKRQTRLFLRTLPEDNLHNNPKFLRNLVTRICDYLSIYVCRANWVKGLPENKQNLKRNECTKNLFKALYTNNDRIKKVTNDFTNQHNKEWGNRQKEKRLKQAEREHHKVNVNVSYTEEIDTQLAIARLKTMIAGKRRELAEYKHRKGKSK